MLLVRPQLETVLPAAMDLSLTKTSLVLLVQIAHAHPGTTTIPQLHNVQYVIVPVHLVWVDKPANVVPVQMVII